MAMMPDASVMPYTSYSPLPVTCRKRSPTASGSEAAPQKPGAHRADVAVAQWHLQHRTHRGRHGTGQRDAVAFDDAPEARDHRRVAHADGRHDEQFRAGHEGTQPAEDRAADVEQRQAGSDHVVARDAGERRAAERRGQLAAGACAPRASARRSYRRCESTRPRRPSRPGSPNTSRSSGCAMSSAWKSSTPSSARACRRRHAHQRQRPARARAPAAPSARCRAAGAGPAPRGSSRPRPAAARRCAPAAAGS